MTTTRFTSPDGDVDLLYKQLAEEDLQPLWELSGLLTSTPRPKAVPHLWCSADLVPLAARAGDLVGIDRGGDRRVLACANPGLGGAPYAVGTLWAAVQYLRPGELAPAHRHTPAALRFVLDGDSVWTSVDGDAVPMAAGDLVLTPSWTFHEHHNSGEAPMMWLDVLDLPLVANLDAVFYEDGPSEDVAISTPTTSRSERVYGSGSGLLPAGDAAAGRNPLLVYRWTETDRALDRQLGEGAAYAHLRYSDPSTGRDVMPTMRCEMMRVPASTATAGLRQTGGRVAAVLHGTGRMSVGEATFGVGPGDIVAVPSWSELRVAADTTLDVFFTTDAPVLRALGLYRDQVRA